MLKKRWLGLTVSLVLAASLLAGCSSGSKPAEAPKEASKETGKIASTFPNKPITVLNSSTAGSPADVMAREVARYAEKYLGQPMVVVNKPGGGGGVMFAALKAEPADGYTIASVTASQIAALQSELKKDFSIDDFEFIANVQKEPYAIAVKANSSFKTMHDVIDFAKKNPGKLKIGGQGTGSALHLMILQLAEQAGIEITWVPFGGGSESVTNLLGNNVQVISTAPATVNQYVEAGQIKVLAISGDQRMEHMKEVPTLKELGYDITMTQYRGFIAKKGLPSDVKAKIVDAIKKAVAEPGFKEYMAKNKQPDGFMGPDDFAAYARKDYELIGQLLQKVKEK
ncbi:Tripartite tricarboxylate transporter family receptor [Neomoorella glycerini]|uniref:Tripartite tricarboxylate transporter family receptor n=1 Tax=Neomoorella glycerini TaxID=55779 RepID=A0A6I5ZW24_9FIRM|nr:tripartite tricarboxylate transporter substrate binding protein [Moorella glycerini]QGP94026.1 Tripartite tricarboxylate transporter family receptor [Moorella glycerini]